MIFFSEQDMILLADGESQITVTLEAVAQAAVILLIGIAIIVSNVLVVAALLTGSGGGDGADPGDPLQQQPPDAMSYYLLSLAVADLLCGVLVVPLSVYPAVVRRWVYGELVCRLEGYLEITLWTATVFTFMWIGVDRYLAIRKPVRYETLQTRTRCQCWMGFSWVSAALLCSPPLLGFAAPSFSAHAYVCTLDWSTMLPYACTLTALVLGPSLITICYTYFYIFATMRRVQRSLSGSGAPSSSQDKEYSTALSENLANPYHLMSFTLIALFWLSWLPLIGLHLYEQWAGSVDSPLLHFGLTWMAVLNSFWKTLVYIAMSPQFRRSLRAMCVTLCCRWLGKELPPPGD